MNIETVSIDMCSLFFPEIDGAAAEQLAGAGGLFDMATGPQLSGMSDTGNSRAQDIRCEQTYTHP